MSSPIRSASASGPIGCAQPFDHPAVDVLLGGEARLVHAHGGKDVGDQQRVDDEARAVLGVDRGLAERPSANWRARASVCSEVMIERTSSTSGSTGTGLKKCMPSTRSGLRRVGGELHDRHRGGVGGEEPGVGQDAVELAGTARAWPARPPRSPRSPRRRPRGPRGGCVYGEALARRRPTVRLELARARRAVERLLDLRPRPLAALSSSTSTTVTSTPERAHTSAIPEPIRPPPITPTRMAGTLVGSGHVARAAAPGPRRRSRGRSPSRGA